MKTKPQPENLTDFTRLCAELSRDLQTDKCAALRSELDAETRANAMQFANWVKETDELRAELAEMRKDKERLDWMEANSANVKVDENSGYDWLVFPCPFVCSSNLRSAIDAAIAYKALAGTTS